MIARTMAHVFPHTALVRVQDRDTILLLWRLRMMYFLGADPESLSRIYYR